ncbi:ATP-binding protein [Thermobifida cellulosilytica]|uniref:Anti-sigma regulatory factor n=1 Tax=Thermobifida cellulosilytica TB100 TaxID=665004 RepID=A0A147KGS0_THECS|nr:ATP-binding protein [Thermobifida cellulosilytica]KUP96468.1 anti-sigma regulatory factor [Thermobifida cellulosilytica TB100]
MAIVQLTISALPAHVRTARLMATAVARRAGVSESTLDEIRLAVGEACSRAVEAHRTHCPEEPIRLELIDSSSPTGPGGSAGPDRVNGSGSDRFEVVVSDRAPAKENGSPLVNGFESGAPAYLGESVSAGGFTGLSPDVGLAVIMGLADEVSIEPSENGTVVRMSWPLSKVGAEDSDPRGLD